MFDNFPEPQGGDLPHADEPRAAAMALCGQRLLLDVRGALFVPDHGLLVVSDLHFEKGSHFAARGIPLPPYDTAATLRIVAALCAHYRPRRVIALGDSFHDHGSAARMDEADSGLLRALTARHDWIWIAGNHDPEPPPHFGGSVECEVECGPLLFRHIPRAAPAAGEIAGHLHPVAALKRRGRRLRRRCFASDGRRLVMPALGAYTGGLNVRDQAFGALFDAGFHAWMMGDERVFPVRSHRLLGERERG